MQNFYDYRPAHLVKGKNNVYVAFSVVNPENGKLTVKRIKLNYIKSKSQLKTYSEELIKQINAKLSRGYNPFFVENSDKLILLSDSIKEFLKAKKRDLETKIICSATFDDYKQQLKTFSDFINTDVFLFKIKRSDVCNFLDFIYIDKALTAVTRNHYLQTLRTFFNYAVNKGFLTENPAKDIQNVKAGIKKRSAIPDSLLTKIFDYLQDTNKNYLLACYLLYGCFIRPSEICGLKIQDISFKNQTIFISSAISKNKKNQVVTIPQNIIKLMLDLEIYKNPSDFYIIGKNFAPAAIRCSDKILRAYWLQVRKKLNFSDSYQFYSLKDSGITKMINLLNVAEVRDQARHSSISITDVYTDRTKQDGNEHIKNLNFKPTV